ncbi:pyridoxamine 5'-phosphate oxidase family protein [Streptomyces sp. MRC013]|uniref:pyridoxamine 5'-phosphate oxidase family protein n=1 Tax=Streptomyces sp. MRC013 TaxID=2898276 RepID=UPI002026AAD2|nr:pyridoxamine 5'-phosphate oxidase family protein [Streptomyces sp. MRC013]URM91434.1 pyridoxamine 5'-phosphate oxidase family protein [Streptomyces sp. MRC013]
MIVRQPVRDREQRKHDVLRRFAEDHDLWAATASAAGAPLLVPLSFVWDDDTFLISTRRANPTARNLTPRGRVRLGLGHTRDVVLVDGMAEAVEGCDLPRASADAFAAKLGWDPRDCEPWVYLRVTPRTVKAWREEAELPDRLLMRDGTWLA